jgi:hypothetical protein
MSARADLDHERKVSAELVLEVERLRADAEERVFNAFHDARHLRRMGGAQMYNTIKRLAVELDAVANRESPELATTRANLAACRERLARTLDAAEPLAGERPDCFVCLTAGCQDHKLRPAPTVLEPVKTVQCPCVDFEGAAWSRCERCGGFGCYPSRAAATQPKERSR